MNKAKPDDQLLNDLRDLVKDKSVGNEPKGQNTSRPDLSSAMKLAPEMQNELVKLQSLFSGHNPEGLLNKIFETYLSDMSGEDPK